MRSSLRPVPIVATRGDTAPMLDVLLVLLLALATVLTVATVVWRCANMMFPNGKIDALVYAHCRVLEAQSGLAFPNGSEGASGLRRWTGCADGASGAWEPGWRGTKGQAEGRDRADSNGGRPAGRWPRAS